MEHPRFTDMRGIERDLSGDPAYAKLGKAIRLATLAQSCKSDLAQAVSCCSTLRDLLRSPRKRGTLERSTTENALLFTAVSLYGRATATVGKDQERGSGNVFDPVAVFGSAAGVQIALDGIPAGHATGLLQGSPKA